MRSGRFVAYEPTSLQVWNGKPTRAEASRIRADLIALRPYFDGLITYGAVDGAEQIPAIAASLGFRAVIIGIWDPFDPVQIDAALAAAEANPAVVAGLSLANETVFAKRHSFSEVAALAARIRRHAANIPISTTEPFHMYYEPDASGLLAQLDFLLVNVHPVFQPWFRAAPDSDAAQFVVNVVTKLAESYCGPILVKEVGVPTAPTDLGFTPERQDAFYRALRQRFPPSSRRAFAYFSAFDAPWRAYDEIPAPAANAVHTAEAHWGLFDPYRKPKPAVAQIPPLSGQALSAAGAGPLPR